MPDLSIMAEATKLTREGRLVEATALLRGDTTPNGGPSVRAERPSKPKRAKGRAARGASPDIPVGARWTRGTHQASEGTRDYALFVPSQLAPEPGLVVMLHGCTQDASDFAVGTRMNAHAEQHGFAVLYPEQSRAANQNGCWNWFDPGHQHGGEAAVIAGMARAIGAEVGTKRAYLAGLSAGGAMAACIAAAAPGGFAGLMVHSGLPAGSASDLPSALQAMRAGAAGKGAPSGLPTLVVHGDADRTVSPANAEALAAHAASAAEVTVQTREAGVAGGRRFTRVIERTPDGRVLCETLTVAGGGHGWFGGDPRGSHVETGIDASAEAVRFFGLGG